MSDQKLNTEDMLAAEEAYGEQGIRQMRAIQFGDQIYVDRRDIAWAAKVNRIFYGNLLFWAQVEIVALLEELADERVR